MTKAPLKQLVDNVIVCGNSKTNEANHMQYHLILDASLSCQTTCIVLGVVVSMEVVKLGKSERILALCLNC